MKSVKQFFKEHKKCERGPDGCQPRIKCIDFPQGVGLCSACGVKVKVKKRGITPLFG